MNTVINHLATRLFPRPQGINYERVQAITDNVAWRFASSCSSIALRRFGLLVSFRWDVVLIIMILPIVLHYCNNVINHSLRRLMKTSLKKQMDGTAQYTVLLVLYFVLGHTVLILFWDGLVRTVLFFLCYSNY